jgi:hypothetical protein
LSSLTVLKSYSLLNSYTNSFNKLISYVELFEVVLDSVSFVSSAGFSSVELSSVEPSSDNCYIIIL